MFTGGLDSQIDKLPVPFPFRRKVIGVIPGGADAATGGGEAAARGWRHGHPHPCRGALPWHVAPASYVGHAAAVILADPLAGVLRGDRGGPRCDGDPAEDDVTEDVGERAEHIKSMLAKLEAGLHY